MAARQRLDESNIICRVVPLAALHRTYVDHVTPTRHTQPNGGLVDESERKKSEEEGMFFCLVALLKTADGQLYEQSCF